MDEEEKREMIAVIHIRLNGSNTRVQKDEIQAIFNVAKSKATEMGIEAEMTFFDR